MSAVVDVRRALPRRPRWITFLAAAFALSPLVLLTSASREAFLRAPFHVPFDHLLSAFAWSLWQPGRFPHRAVSFASEQWGLGFALLPALGVVLGAVALMLITVAPANARTSPRRRIAAGAALGLSPGFLIAVTMGAPVVWGLIAWAITLRAIGPCEGRENIQQEMSMGIGMSLVLLSEPLAWWLLAPVLLGMPVLLRRQHRDATAAAVTLGVTPVLLMLACIVFALAILSESMPGPHLWRWLDSLATTDPVVPLVTMGPELAIVVGLVGVPSLVLFVVSMRDRRRRYHPGALFFGAVCPTLAMLWLAHRGHEEAARVVALYAIAGQAVWLAQTPLPRRAFRWGIVFVLAALVGQYVL